MICICLLSNTYKLQGGFCGGPDTEVQYWHDDGWQTADRWFLDDKSGDQTFACKEPISCQKLRILFTSSTDFFGRITMYKLDVFNSKSR